jgi:hypothetical protein
LENLLDWLQNIYADDLCNGSWEHEHGFTITNIDNPGWDFRFEVKDIDIEEVPFTEVSVQIDEKNWYRCFIKDGVFVGFGGAKNLTDIITVFKEWYLYASQIEDDKWNNNAI